MRRSSQPGDLAGQLFAQSCQTRGHALHLLHESEDALLVFGRKGRPVVVSILERSR